MRGRFQLSVPEGFELLETGSPFTNWAGPFYAQLVDGEVRLGFEVAEHHCNSGGRLHGAMVCAAADLALGRNIGMAMAEAGHLDGKANSGRGGAPVATVSLNTDFMGTAKVGDWVEVHVDVQKAGRNLGFANAYLVSKRERIARASAVFKVLG